MLIFNLRSRINYSIQGYIYTESKFIVHLQQKILKKINSLVYMEAFNQSKIIDSKLDIDNIYTYDFENLDNL